MSRQEAGRRPFVRSLARGLDVLTAFSRDAAELTLSEVAERADLARATARRLLLTLESLGYVRRDGRHFSLTPGVLDIGRAYLSSLDLASAAESEMEALVERFDEASSASVLDDTEIVYVVRVPAERIMAVSLGLGSRLPAWATSMGRVLLAALDDDARRATVEASSLRPLTDRTITDPERLLDELGRVRRRGWALVDQELEEGVRSVAVPLHDAHGRIIAAMNLGTHAGRWTLAQVRGELLPTLQAAAGRIDERLARR